MFCKQCGNELKDGAMFCTNCGANQGAAAAPAQPVEQDLEKTVGVFDAMPGVQQAQPVAEAPVQPVVEDPVQPVVEAPAQPVQQPVQQPVYQAPVQQPAQPTYQAAVQQQNAYNPNAGAAHNGKVGFGEAIKLFFKNYANFSGRASKSEYWWAFLFNCLASFVLGLIPYVGAVISLGLIIPGLSLNIRRLHDSGKAWYYLLMGLIPFAGFIILIVYFCADSDGDNEWGPGPNAPVYGSGQFVNTPVSNAAPAQRVVTDNDIYAMAQNHEPVNLSDPNAKGMLDAALSRIVPTYTGMEDLAGAMMLCDPQTIKANIAATDTDSLIVIFKALGYYIGQGGDANVLGMVQQNVLATLKTRF